MHGGTKAEDMAAGALACNAIRGPVMTGLAHADPRKLIIVCQQHDLFGGGNTGASLVV
jgi:hypothetical protein